LRVIFVLICILFAADLSFCQKAKPKVYVVISEECPICIYMSKPLNEIFEKYKSKVDFQLVFPLSLSNYKTMQLYKKKYNLSNIPGYLDEDQSLSKKLGATVTPEAIVENEKGVIVYRGRINDAYYSPGRLRHAANKNDLIDVIEAVLNRKSIATPWPKAVGCYITYIK
jgi:hypothetical protein